MFGTNGLEVPHILTQICTRFPTVDLKILGSCVCGSSKIAKKKKFKKCWIFLPSFKCGLRISLKTCKGLPQHPDTQKTQ